jgi:peptide/nickel transport system permease protein
MQVMTNSEGAAGQAVRRMPETAPARDWRRETLRHLGRSRAALLSLAFLALISLVALAAPLLAPHDPSRVNMLAPLKPPMWLEEGDPRFLLGTDSLGRDVLSQLIFGARVSLLVGLTVVAIGGTLGTVLGLVAGYYGGLLDDVIMRLADIQLAFPFILMAITFLAVLGPGLENLILVLAVGSWMNYARVMRSQVLSLREKEFVEASHALGIGDTRILFRHLLPNAITPIIVIASFSVASTIIAEASLSFLGLGVKPSTPTWGAMLANGREYITDAWWLVVTPGVAIMLTVLSINILGDWLRDRLDPRLRI